MNSKTTYLQNKCILGAVLSDSISSLKSVGYTEDHMIKYYNPMDFFKEVHIFTINESKEYQNYKIGDKIYVHGLKRPLIPGMMHIMYPLFVIWYVKKYNIDILRAFNPFTMGLSAVIAGKIFKKPIVLSIHSAYRYWEEYTNHYYLYSKKLTNFIEKIVLKYADRIFCVYDYYRKYVEDLGADPEKTCVIYNRIDPDIFSMEKSHRLQMEYNLKENSVVVFVGRLDYEKLPEDVLKTVPLVIKEQPDAQFLFVGDGPMRDELISLSKELGIENSVKFVGAQDNEKVAEFMSVADVITCPLSGFVLIEAAASGKPIVAYDFDWHSELIENGKTGILVENRNIEEMAKGIISLLENPEYASKLGMSAREIVLKYFTWDAVSGTEVENYLRSLEPLDY